jgi:hypothetical protein
MADFGLAAPCAPVTDTRLFSEGFDPRAWLAAFVAVGGGYVLRDRLSLINRIEGQTDHELITARQLIVDLTSEKRPILIDYLSETLVREAGND